MCVEKYGFRLRVDWPTTPNQIGRLRMTVRASANITKRPYGVVFVAVVCFFEGIHLVQIAE
jgi:hypothetical protein